MPVQDSKFEQELIFTRKDDDEAYDLSGQGIGAEFYSGDGCTKITLIEGSGIDVTDAATGVVAYLLTPSQINTLGVGQYRALMFTQYANDTNREILAEGSGVIEGKRFDA